MTRSSALRTPPWLLDEVATAGRENLDPQHAARYDAKENWPAVEEVRLVQALGVPRDATVVDLGAGTGQFALAACGDFRRVVAVDVSDVMLGVLGAKAARAGAENLEIVKAGFLTYEHGGPAAGLVYSRYALHHLPDFWKALALRRMHAMLAPGGIVRLWDIVYSFDVAVAEQELEAWRSSLGETAPDGEWARADIDDHIRDEHSTFTWLLEPMCVRAGFTVEQSEYSEDGIFAKYVLRRS